MKGTLFVPLLILVLTVLACALPGGAVPAIAPGPTATAAPAALEASPTPFQAPASPSAAPLRTAVIPALTADKLRNGTYYAPYYRRTVTLKDGAFSSGSGADYYSVQMLDLVANGDLNGDGVEDAAILLAETGGGSGVFESVWRCSIRAGSPTLSGRPCSGIGSR